MPTALELLKKHEGFRRFPYRDTKGVETIGYGRNLRSRGLSESEASTLLQNDIDDAEIALSASLPWFNDLNTQRQAVLLDMAVNLGVVGLLKFTTFLNLCAEGRFDEASIDGLATAWAHEVKGRATELMSILKFGDS